MSERSPTDVELQAAPWVEQPETVLELLERMKETHRPYEAETFLEASVNERFVAGRQALDISDGVVTDLDEDGVRYPTRNLLRNYVLTWAARILEDRPSVKAWPSDASLGDMAKVEIANAVIRHQYARQDLDAMFSRAAKLAQMHTCVGFKIAWDPDVGPMGQGVDGPVRLGEISVDLVSVFDYLTDGAEHVRDSQWCAFRKYVDEDTAMSLLWGKFKDETIRPQAEKRETLWQGEEDGVEVWEMWVRPSPRYPVGVFAVVVGGHVLDARPFPYKHGELPLAVWKIGSKRDHPHGDSHVSDARKVQQDLNRTLNVRREVERAFADACRLFGPKDIVDQVDAEHAVINTEDPDWKQKVGYMDPPKATLAEIDQRIEQHQRDMGMVFGLNEAIYGAENAKSTSGRAIAYLKELDSQKLSEASRNLGEVLRRMFRQVIRLTQQYVDQTRLVHIAGPDSAIQAVAFRGAELEGVDIILEPTSGAERWRAAQVGKFEEEVAAGFADPKQLRGVQETGLLENGMDNAANQRVQQQIMQAMEGHLTPPLPDVNPQVAIREVQTALQVAPEAAPVLQQLLAAYQQAAQQRAMAAQQQMAQQRRTPGAKPQLMKQEPPTMPSGLPKTPAGGL